MTNNKSTSLENSIHAFRDSVFESFAEVDDPRVLTGAIRHKFIHILFMTLCAVLCGANNVKEIAIYAKERSEWLRTVLKLPHGVPSYSTFWLVFAMLDPKAFHNGFSRWILYLVPLTKGGNYAIDGKALRATALKGKPNSFIHMVSLWASDQQITLGQTRVNGKSNEITAIPKLLEMIDIEGAIITIDAMGTQTKIARQIIETKGDYILALKGNQSSLCDEVENFFNQAEAIGFSGVEHESYHAVEEGHGRLEKRSIYVTEQIDWLPGRARWKGLKSVVLLISKRRVDGKTTVERRMYISSLGADAKQIAYAIRSHWGIEVCHWHLDVSFQEDSLKARTGHIAENLSLIRKMALALLKQDKVTKAGIEAKRKKAGWNPSYLLELIGVKF